MYGPFPVIIILFSVGFLIILHALKTKKHKKHARTFDELLLGAFHIILCFIYPLYYLRFPSLSSTLYLLTNILAVATICFLLLILAFEKFNVSKHPYLKKKRSYASFKKNFLSNYNKQNRYKRRITHIIPALVILPIYLIGKSFAPLLPDWEAWCVGLITSAGVCFVLVFSIADLVRVSKPELLPEWASKLFSKGLNKEEVLDNTFTTSSAMILGFAPWLLAGLLVFTIVSLVASVSDAMAAITGFRFGRHRFPKKGRKTVEGYIAGILTTFSLVIASFFILSTINPLLIILFGLFLAGAFFLVDVLNLPIDDNKINPQVIGFVLLILLASFR